jgi:ligand-binding SRPBCC domain-containing protein
MSTPARGPMETIRMTTQIKAPVDRCFMLSTSIDLHLAAAASTGESVVDGVATGLIRDGETVKWKARRFGFTMTHKCRIEAWRPYSYFRDVMVEGTFAAFEHDHHFAPMNDGTRMRDELRFAAPLGLLGRLAEKWFLRKHLTSFLRRRNTLLKQVAESEEWRQYLKSDAKGEISA